MTVLQLVRGGADAGLKPVPNPAQLPPEQFIKNGAFLAGSDDLVNIAIHLSRHNFKILKFTFVDRFFQPIGDERNDKLSDDLRNHISQGTHPEFLRNELGELSVDSVRLRDLTTRGNIQIWQEGIVTTRSDNDVPSLRAGLADMAMGF